jgi:membrane dipeptidase
VADLSKLRQAMAKHGYNDVLMTKLCHENWLRVLKKTWGK